MSYELTRNAQALLIFAYKLYCERREAGLSKDDAMEFASEDFAIYRSDIAKFSDYADTLNELTDVFVEYIDSDGNFHLTSTAIVYGERQFPNKLIDILDWLARFKNATPFL